ncbi:carboxymuconolactone decarboxylase family protein [Ruicaihuangia caeni]
MPFSRSPDTGPRPRQTLSKREGVTMPRLSRLTPETAVGASRDLLGELVGRHAHVGDMVSTMAHSPAVLGGYLQLSRSMRRAKLDRKISERISIAVQAQQGCRLCLQSHVAAARSLGISDEGIELAHAGSSADASLAAIIVLGLQVYREPMSITDEQIDNLRAHGYSDREVADVVGIVALNILTGAFNLLAGLTPGNAD